MLGFDDVLENDHLGMLTNKEFGVSCTNATKAQTFNIIKTDAFILVDAEGLPIIEDKPVFNTSKNFLNGAGVLTPIDIEQHDILTIDSKEYIVSDVRQDGIGGVDVYLKDRVNV